MFAEAGEYEACGIFSKEHFILIGITIIGIVIALKNTANKNKEEVYKIIKCITIVMWVLEIFKMLYSLMHNSLSDVNTYLPLYYCSMTLYAGLFSSFGKGKLKRMGDVILATGSIIGGIVFIIYPSTSLPTYPAFHFLSLHSFLYHGTMIYLGLLLNITNYIEITKEDIKYFSSLTGIMCVVAFIINKIFDSNLMFISQNLSNTPIEWLYNITGGNLVFTLVLSIGQMTIPFFVVYWIRKKIKDVESNKNEDKLALDFAH